MAASVAQVRFELAKVFHQSPESADEWISVRTLYVRAVLDVLVRDGSRLLIECENITVDNEHNIINQ